MGYGRPMSESNKKVHLTCKWRGRSKSGKTIIYRIMKRESWATNVGLGYIKWYGAWRKYVFFPDKNTLWDNNCLNMIIRFLDKINKRHGRGYAKK